MIGLRKVERYLQISFIVNCLEIEDVFVLDVSNNCRVSFLNCWFFCSLLATECILGYKLGILLELINTFETNNIILCVSVNIAQVT